MFIVYIIQSFKNNSYYIGHTDNLSERLSAHNSGKNISTKHGSPWCIVYTEEYKTRSEAMKRENEIKRKKRKSYIEWLINNNKL